MYIYILRTGAVTVCVSTTVEEEQGSIPERANAATKLPLVSTLCAIMTEALVLLKKKKNNSTIYFFLVVLQFTVSFAA